MTYPICNISKVTNCDIKSGLIYAYQASIDYGQTQFHPEMELVAYDVSPQEEIAEALQLALREVAFKPILQVILDLMQLYMTIFLESSR